jgi:hypothetical protein
LRVILLRTRFELHLFVWGLSAPQMEIMKALLLTQFSPLPLSITERWYREIRIGRGHNAPLTPITPISSSLFILLRLFAAELVEEDTKMCGKILTVLSWMVVILTMPFSLFVCFKVSPWGMEIKLELLTFSRPL